MRPTILIFIAMPVAARSSELQGSMCRLTAAECMVVAREIAIDAELFVQDEEILGIGLPPQERAKALIQRDTERMAERLHHLPVPIANEISRMQICQVLDEAAQHDGSANSGQICN